MQDHKSCSPEGRPSEGIQTPVKSIKKSVDVHIKVFALENSRHVKPSWTEIGLFYMIDVLLMQMVKSSSKHIPFEVLLRFALKTPGSKRTPFQQGIIASHRKILQATNLLEAPDSLFIQQNSSMRGAPDDSGCLGWPGLVPVCCLLMQACHECSHTPLLESHAWKEHKPKFKISKLLQKFLSKAGDDGFWKSLAPYIELPELCYMVVWLKDALLEQRLNGTSTVGGQLGQQILDGDRALESYQLFAERARRFLCRCYYC